MQYRAKLAKIAGIMALVALGMLFLVPNATINNFPLVESAQLFLQAVLLLCGATATVLGLLAWRHLSVVWRSIAFAAPAISLSLLAVDRFATPNIQVNVVYVGPRPTKIIDISFGFGSVRTEIKQGIVWSNDFGRPTPKLLLEWGDSYEERRKQQQEFDIFSRIPRFGSDRTINLTLHDTNAEMTIHKK